MLMMKKGYSTDQPNPHSDDALCAEISGSAMEHSLRETQNAERNRSITTEK
jgi:hypothetical protein